MTDRHDTDEGERRCPHHDLIIEGFGSSGKNGRVGNLARSLRYVKEELKDEIKEIKSEMKSIKSMQVKLMLSTCAGGGLVAGMVKLLFA